MVSCLILKSLHNFEFIFVYGVRECSNFIDFHAAVQLSQHHLPKRVVFFPLYIHASFVEDKLTVGTWVYFLALYFVPLIHLFLCQYHAIFKILVVPPPPLETGLRGNSWGWKFRKRSLCRAGRRSESWPVFFAALKNKTLLS